MNDLIIDIVYEDNHIVVVNKPVNVPSQADVSGDVDMLSMVKQYIKEKYEKPGDVYIGLVHRLDRPAGGLMVFARTSKAASRLSEQMRSKKIVKKYLAVVSGICPVGDGVTRLEGYIEKDSTTNKVAVYDIKKGDAKFAALEYECLQCASPLSLVRVSLETGRPHQIRAQMAHAGLPLYGDQKYGDGRVGQQLALWSNQLSFAHPVTQEVLNFVSPPPQETQPWRVFSTLRQTALL
ncbi:MAG: RluA family pseudouridine synthase [Clostridia bacterium]